MHSIFGISFLLYIIKWSDGAGYIYISVVELGQEKP